MERPAQAGAAVILLALAGCGGMPATSSTTQLANAISMTREQGGRFIGLVGQRTQHEAPFLGVPDTNYFLLRSWMDTSTGEIVHQLYVEDSYFGAKRKWDAASANGQSLRFVPISVNEITCDQNCSYAEEFAAALPDRLLRASAGGLAVRFTAKTGADKLVLVRGDLIQKQLAAIDQARSTLPTVTTAAVAPPASPPLAAPQR